VNTCRAVKLFEARGETKAFGGENGGRGGGGGGGVGGGGGGWGVAAPCSPTRRVMSQALPSLVTFLTLLKPA